MVTDRKLPVADANDNTKIAYFTADVVSFADYLPFGQIMPNRHGYTGTKYRFGFQDQEMDDEIMGEDNIASFKYRMEDVRLGRFFSVDPLTKDYPWNSPFAFSENNVIHCVELEGLEKIEKYKPTTYIKPEISHISSLSCLVGPHSTKPTTLVFSTKELKTMGTIASFSGATITVAGVICNFIPTPQTQAAGKALIPIGSTISDIGTGLTVSALTMDGDKNGVVRELTVSEAFKGLGKSVDALHDANKLNADNLNGMKGLLGAEEPLVGNEASKYFPDKKTKNDNNPAIKPKPKGKVENKTNRNNSTATKSMPEFVKQFQK